MENGRCSCGLLRAYPLPREFPRPGGGRAEWVGAGSRPLPHTRCGAEPGIPAHRWASPFANPLPSHKPYSWESQPGGRPCRVGRREKGAPGQVHKSWGAEMPGLLSRVVQPCAPAQLCPFPEPPPSSKLLHCSLLLLPVTFCLFRVQYSVWLSAHLCGRHR